jgi:hypothetical protein
LRASITTRSWLNIWNIVFLILSGGVVRASMNAEAKKREEKQAVEENQAVNLQLA